MGLIDSTQNISKAVETLNSVSVEKENKSELGARLERKLDMYFKERFMQYGITYVYEFYNINTRNEIIKELGTNDFEYVKIDKLYDKVLKRVVRTFQQHEKYLDWTCNSLKEGDIDYENAGEDRRNKNNNADL